MCVALNEGFHTIQPGNWNKLTEGKINVIWFLNFSRANLIIFKMKSWMVSQLCERSPHLGTQGHNIHLKGLKIIQPSFFNMIGWFEIIMKIVVDILYKTAQILAPAMELLSNFSISLYWQTDLSWRVSSCPYLYVFFGKSLGPSSMSERVKKSNL